MLVERFCCVFCWRKFTNQVEKDSNFEYLRRQLGSLICAINLFENNAYINSLKTGSVTMSELEIKRKISQADPVFI